MERQSPPTQRVTRLLDLLATQPREGVALSELARRLDMSKATCLGIVGALTRAGYLVRDEPTKTYTLGPALLSLGQAAAEAFSSLAYARPEIRRLHQEFGLATTVSARAGEDIVVLERTGTAGELDRMVQVGQRYPYAPPSGCVLAAWLGDEEIERWLADHPAVPMGPSIDALRALVDSCRDVGYFVEQMSDISLGALTVLAGFDGHDLPDPVARALRNMVSDLADRHHLARDLRPGGRYAVTFIAAPSYDANARPDLLLGLLVFRHDVTFAEVERYGDAVRRAARRVTGQAGGRDPWAGATTVPPCRVALPGGARR
ncbi:MAG TPA: helix-turn-helix domain-containing protein [Acidimicrobiia bacterium]